MPPFFKFLNTPLHTSVRGRVQDQTVVADHQFREGWRLEAVDGQVIRPATVTRLINQSFFVVQFDDLTRPGNQLCCHAGSLNIFPVGWCSANNIPLTPVPGMFRFVTPHFLSKTSQVNLVFC